MKVVIEPLDNKTSRDIGAKGTTVRKRRITTRSGEKKDLWVFDVASETFATNFTYVFGRNVAKARRENKRLLGSADGVAVGD